MSERRGAPRIAARLLIAAALTGGALLALAGPASAHALVARSEPADGAILSSAPSQVLLTFTEAPDPKLSFVKVLDSSGQPVKQGPSQTVPGHPTQLRVSLQPLPDGAYTISWRTVSQVDGHVTGGALTFGIGVAPSVAVAPSGGSTPSTPSPSPLAVAGRWAFYWGLAILVGAGAVGTFILRDVSQPQRVLVAGSWLVAVVGLLMMTLAERSAIGIGIGALLRSATGGDLVGRAAALAVAGVMVGLVLLRPRWTSMPGVFLAAAGVLYIHALAGHAGGESPVWFNVGDEWLHMLSIGVWVGGLAWLMLGIRGTPSVERAVAARQFARLATVALAATVATGVVRAIAELGSVGALFSTSFGVTLLIKTGLVAALIALGAANHYRNAPALMSANRGEPDQARFRRFRLTARWELAVAAAVLVATAILSELPPGASVQAAAARPASPVHVVVTGSDFATTVRATLTVTPGTAGPNLFEARVLDFDTGKPVAALRVGLDFSLPAQPSVGTSHLELTKGPAGVWSARGTNLSIDGRWDVTLTIQEATGGVQVTMHVQPRLPPEHITVASVPGQPTLYTIALAGGGTVQTYVDPATAGVANIHFTFFQAAGNELPIATATATATPPDGVTAPLPLRRFDPGHFVGTTTLTAGRWRFAIQATTRDGRTVNAYFQETIGATPGG